MPVESWIMIAWFGVLLVTFLFWLRTPRQRRVRIRLWEWLGLLLSVFAAEPAPHVEPPDQDPPRLRPRPSGKHRAPGAAPDR